MQSVPSVTKKVEGTKLSESERKHNVRAAEVMTTASAIGALQHCRANNTLESDLVEPAFERLKAMMVPLAELPPENILYRMGALAYRMYQVSAMEGTYTVMTAAVETGDVTIETFDAGQLETCKMTANYLKASMETKGRLLNGVTPPLKPGDL